MRWKLTIDPSTGEFLVENGGVIDLRTRDINAAHAKLAERNGHREAMVAAAGDQGEAGSGRAFFAVLAVDEIATSQADGRYMEFFEWETVPLSLWRLCGNQGGGHKGSEVCGTIRTIEKLSDGRRVFATGNMASTDAGAETSTLVEEEALRFISVDPSDWESEWEVLKIGTDGWPIEERLRFTRYRIGGATVLGNPGIRLAVIWLDGMDAPGEFTEPLPLPIERVQIPEIVDVNDEDSIIVLLASAAEQSAELEAARAPAAHAPFMASTQEEQALLASAHAERVEEEAPPRVCVLTENCGGPALIPAEWARPQELRGPTPLQLTPQGHLFGNVALFDVPHRGFLHYSWSEKIYAPRSRTGYAEFAVNPIPVGCCSDPHCGHQRDQVNMGVLTCGTLHADKKLSMAQARAFYENSGLQAADGIMWDNDWGPCFSGGLRPEMDDARVRELLGSTPSGDWRWIRGNLELCAVLGVNMGGIPVLASAYSDEAGELRTLIAGWGDPQASPDEALVASAVAALAPQRRRPAAGAPRLEATLTVDTDAVVRKLEQVLGPRLSNIEGALDLLAPELAARLDERMAELSPASV